MPARMESSMTMIDAQVHFLDENLVLVHIPLDLYPYFLKAVLRLLFDEIPPLEEEGVEEEDVVLDDIETGSGRKSNDQPAFLNISITPVEVSVICPRRLVDKYFTPLMDQLDRVNASLRSRVEISENDYIAMQVLGQGLEAGKRVLELTSPLAMAGISIFFISTYFSDYIIVPLHSKTSVMSALESRGFQFDCATDTFINSPLGSPLPHLERRLSDAGRLVTPPPSTLAELQTRTFDSLRKRQISPYVDDSLRLVQCAAHHQYTREEESSMTILRDALTTVLLVDEPRFFSLTLPSLDPAASLLLEKRLLPRFARHSSSHKDYEDGSGLLLGSKEDYLIPIMLDLRDLPLEATGIVCGVAGRLAEATHTLGGGHETNSNDNTRSNNDSGNSSIVGSHGSSVLGSVPALFETIGTRLATSGKKHTLAPLPPTTHHHLKPDIDSTADAVEISFLSTARAGTIIVGEDELRRAIDALEAEKGHEAHLEDAPLQMENPADAEVEVV
ncbi:hypothetical protein N7474_000331 [Penicillium riverlandense]|uniref:uncharacterized protein n=1 Tax=Penicillium riverlandense TaxID=1903569 RepID=UPI0025495B90|nr:uncharacterized protein N7474_000331 [Penicillium riverlandense]KAJ5832020.1 hypothetical protein N7474_000331 [Penicillium riverlandense]